MLLRTFLAHPESAALCDEACVKVDGRWTGNARVSDSEHQVGDTEVVGECPGKMLATSTPTESVGEIGCECAS